MDVVPSRGLAGLAEQLVFFSFFPLHSIVMSVTAYITFFMYGGRRIRGALIAYSALSILDRSPSQGGWFWPWHFGVAQFLRKSVLWRLSAAGRGPFRMLKTVPLPPEDGPYIFSNHPHGIIGVAPMTNFGTDVTGLQELCPGTKVHLLGASAIFLVPFFREWCLLHGHSVVSRSSCMSLLEKGHSIALAPGGARESLESRPGTMRLILKDRKGFVKLALSSGAALVPVLSFGENELYSTIQFEAGTWTRSFQRAFQRIVGFALPIFVGRNWLFPLMPKRTPIVTIVGAPVRADRDDTLDGFHNKYCGALRELFDRHKSEYGLGDAHLELV